MSPIEECSSTFQFRDGRAFRRGDARIHRVRRMDVGPDVWQMRVDPFHSFPNVVNKLATNKAAKAGATLHGTDLAAFGIPFSMNRHRRWELPERMAEDIAQYQDAQKGLRLSVVVQRGNPLRKDQMWGKTASVGKLDEQSTTEFHSVDAGAEIHRQCGTARGVNTLAQFLQKGPKAKKRRNGKTGMEAPPEERWLDLFEPRDYSKPISNTDHEENGRKSAKRRAKADEQERKHAKLPLHIYHTFREQHATANQLNSGWQDGTAQRPRTKEEMREGGRWVRGADDQMVWHPMKEDENAASHKHRGGPSAKGGESTALQADIVDLQYGEQHEWEVGGYEDWEWELHYDVERKQTEKANLSEFLVEKKAKTRIPKKRSWSKIEPENDDAEYECPIAPSEESSPSLSSFEEVVDDSSDLWELDLKEAEAMAVNMNVACLDRTGLPQCAGIILSKVDAQSAAIPVGSKLIARTNGKGIFRVFVNPAAAIPLYNRPSTSSIPSTSTSPYNGFNNGYVPFLRDLLLCSSATANKRVFESEALSEESAQEKALQLLLFEEQKDCGLQLQVAPTSLSAGGAEMSLFCGVCFAECADLCEGFALPQCPSSSAASSPHFFCDCCWRRHIGHGLASGKVPITCMASQCPSIVHPNCALLVVAQSSVERYRQLLANKRRMRRDFIVCGQCNGVLHVKMPSNNHPAANVSLTQCAHCAETICTVCKLRQHFPLSCEERELYERILQSNGQSLRQLLLSRDEGSQTTGVRCSSCHNLVERNTGCNHMVCRCGHQFCWYCGGDWNGHRGCNRKGGKITVQLFDLVFARDENGRQRMLKSPEKFFAECAELRALRVGQGRQLSKRMQRVFGNGEEARGWTNKFMQLSEFVELCQAKRLLNGGRGWPGFCAYANRLRFTFRAIPFISDLRNEKRSFVREDVEHYYAETLAICRRISAFAKGTAERGR